MTGKRSGETAGMPSASLCLVAGLGNPGLDYAQTRHNIGFMAVDRLAEQFNIAVERRKFDTLFGRGRIAGTPVVLAKPQAFMNRSGPPVQQLAHFFRIPYKATLIIHDDIDLAFERLKIKEKGGDGGHKGIRSLIGAFGEQNFARLRIGVGRSTAGADVVNHVLGRFSRGERTALDAILDRVCQAVETILSEGTREAMNRFNQKL